jgi:MFS family permease
MEFKEYFQLMFLLIDSLTLFHLTWIFISDLLVRIPFYDTLLISTLFHVALLISATIGAILLHKKLRSKLFLLFWILLGTCTYFISATFVAEVVPNLAVISLVLGAVIGVGIPSCFAFFADYTNIEKRGHFGALAFCIIQLLTVLIYSFINELSVADKLLFFGIWRFIGVTGVFSYKQKSQENVKQSFSSLISEKSFILYFTPWFLFCLINFVEAPVLERFFGLELFNIYSATEIVISSVSVFLGGTLCDSKGRRATSIVGFILLGVGYAILSLFQTQFSTILFMLFDGTAWGILYVTFIFVVWGDFSEEGMREKYYLLGNMPFLLSSWIQTLAKPFVEVIPIYTSFSLASFFLFLAVVPLMFAPETLPEKALRERELRSYIEKAKRVREKFTKG